MWRDPFEEIRRLERRMNRVFSDIWGEMPSLPSLPGSQTALLPYEGKNIWEPLLDLSETEKEFKISADLPGVNKDDIKININENTVDISAETKTEEKEEKEGFLRRERSYTSFKRSFTLPKNIDPKTVKAKYEKGVLTLRLPKVKEEKKTLVKVE